MSTGMVASNVGESNIIQGIVNTIGKYYNVEEILLTVEGKPYEYGHLAFKKGETIKVDMTNVRRSKQPASYIS